MSDYIICAKYLRRIKLKLFSVPNFYLATLAQVRRSDEIHEIKYVGSNGRDTPSDKNQNSVQFATHCINASYGKTYSLNILAKNIIVCSFARMCSYLYACSCVCVCLISKSWHQTNFKFPALRTKKNSFQNSITHYIVIASLFLLKIQYNRLLGAISSFNSALICVS